MKISNFELVETKGSDSLDKQFLATVDVETGFLWWKKTKNVKIRKKFACHWFFEETGKWTPGWEVEDLARAWTAKTDQET